MVKTDIFNRNLEGSKLDSFEYTFLKKAEIMDKAKLKSEECIEESPDRIFKIYGVSNLPDVNSMILETVDGNRQLVDEGCLNFSGNQLKFDTFYYFKELKPLTSTNVVGSLEVLGEDKLYHKVAEINEMNWVISNNNSYKRNGSDIMEPGLVSYKLNCNCNSSDKKTYFKYLFDLEDDKPRCNSSISMKKMRIGFKQKESDKIMYILVDGIVESESPYERLKIKCKNTRIMVGFD